MGERRRKCATVLLRNPSKRAVKIELFPAEEWAGKTDVAPGSFRLRQDLSWVSLGGGQYEFLSLSAVGAYLAAQLVGDVSEEPAPHLPPKSRVRVRLRQVLALPDETEDPESDMSMTKTPVTVSEVTWTCSPAWQGIDGRWRVCVLSQDEPVLVSQVEVLP